MNGNDFARMCIQRWGIEPKDIDDLCIQLKAIEEDEAN